MNREENMGKLKNIFDRYAEEKNIITNIGTLNKIICDFYNPLNEADQSSSDNTRGIF